MTDTTLSLAARLAANLIVDAINLAKPGARLAAKVGDRLLGGSPFNEAEAQRFLLDGADAINKAEDERDVWEPGELREHPLYREVQEHADEQIRLLNETRLLAGKSAFGLTPHGFNTMPNWPQSYKPDPKPPGYWLNAIENTIKDHADFLAPQSSAPSRKPCGACDYTDNGWCPCACHQSSAPVAPKPTDVAGSPEVVASPFAASGSPTWKSVHSLYVNCSYPMRPNAIACSDTCQQPASTAVRPVDNASIFLYRCTHHRGMVDGETIGLIFYSVPTKTPDSQGEQPVGVGVAEPGTGEAAPFTHGDLAEAAQIIRWWAESDGCNDTSENLAHLRSLADRLDEEAHPDPNP